MTYNPNLPENNADALAITQPDFLQNFISLYNSFAINHVPLDASAQAGEHTIIQLPEVNHAVETDAGELSVYTKNVENQTGQIFLKYPNGTEIQLTNYQIYQYTNAPGQYFTILPGKVIVFFGRKVFTKQLNNFIFGPPIVSNVITMSFTPDSATNNNFWYKPTVTIPAKSPNGTIPYLSMFLSVNAFVPSGSITYNHIILGNCI